MSQPEWHTRHVRYQRLRRQYYGVTREMVRQLEEQGIEALNKPRRFPHPGYTLDDWRRRIAKQRRRRPAPIIHEPVEHERDPTLMALIATANVFGYVVTPVPTNNWEVTPA